MSGEISRRRRLLQLMCVAGAAPSVFTRRVQAAEPFPVGILYAFSRQDYGYNQSHANAAELLKRNKALRIVEEERVPETAAAQRTMEAMIRQDGVKLIIATAFGYFKPHVLEVAAKYPQVSFAHCGGIWSPGMPANVGTFYGYIFSGQYVSGVVAGHMTQTRKIGIVASKPTPNIVRSINAFTLGVQSVDPKIAVQVIFTGDWAMPVREAESTNSLVDQGCDIIAAHVDSPKVMVETAEKRGAMSCGYHSSQAAVAPNGYLVGSEWNWIVPYEKFIDSARRAEPPPHHLRGGLGPNFIKATTYGKRVSAKARAAGDLARSRLASGELQVFRGPLQDNLGNTVIPAGKTLMEDDGTLDKINYLVAGVTGRI